MNCEIVSYKSTSVGSDFRTKYPVYEFMIESTAWTLQFLIIHKGIIQSYASCVHVLWYVSFY